MKEAKILKEKSREYKGTSYYKYKINIPQTILHDSDIRSGEIVEIEASKGQILIKKIQKEEKETIGAKK